MSHLLNDAKLACYWLFPHRRVGGKENAPSKKAPASRLQLSEKEWGEWVKVWEDAMGGEDPDLSIDKLTHQEVSLVMVSTRLLLALTFFL